MSTLEAARGRVAAFAALITAVVVCAGDAVARTFPFGPTTRSVSDLGNQFIPYHAHLWDLLHGKADGGILLNWQSGYGSSMLPDLGTYLTSPFALLVGLFPRDRIDLAVYVITVLKMATAAAAMTMLLLRLGREKPHSPWWAAALLGSTYAMCGWSLIYASYNPMWLDGLIAFPMLCLVGEWARAKERPVLSTIVVALAWVANFYTAYMATIGAALVLLLRLYLDNQVEVRQRLRTLVRASAITLLGIGLSTPVLIPVYLGTKYAYPGRTNQFNAASWSDVFARMMPGTYTFATPALFLGTAALLLVMTLVFNRLVPYRERRAWLLLAAAVTLSLQFGPTSLAWHAFAVPNGSSYRETFVLSGILVIAAWICLSHGWPSRKALFGGTGLLVLLLVGASTSELTNTRAVALFLAGLITAAAGLLLVRARGTRGFAVLAALLLVGSVAGQASAVTAIADHQRLSLTFSPTWGQQQTDRRAVIEEADGWPRYRTDPGSTKFTGNDPMLVGGEGGQYYSSMTSDVLSRTMNALGAGWTSHARSVYSLDNPVTDAIFSVGARVYDPVDQPPTVVRSPAPPLVTVRPAVAEAAKNLHFGPSPFANQEALLGSKVYLPPVDKTCPVGTGAYLFAPNYTGSAHLADHQPVRLKGALPARRAALTPLGTATKPHQIVKFGAKAPAQWDIGCLDPKLLSAAVTRLTDTGAVSLHVSDSGVDAQLPPGSTGMAVLSAPRIPGWMCQGKPADSYLGLVATPLNGTSTTVDCSFRPPGLRAGEAAGIASLAALIVLALLARRGRRKGSAAPERTVDGDGSRRRSTVQV